MKKLFCILILLSPLMAFAQQKEDKSFPLDYTWKNVGNAGFSADAAKYISIAVSPAGQPYLAYQDFGNSEKATVMKFDGTNWVYVGSAGFSAGTADYTSLRFSPSGEPYVAFEDYGNSYKATVMKFDGISWVNFGNAGFSTGRSDYLSLAFGLAGQPYVAYEDWGNSYKATVMKFDGTNWVNVGAAGFSGGEAQYTSLAFSLSGHPYVGFWDFGNSYKATVMKYDSVYMGIDEHRQLQLSIYPDPASALLTIETPATPAKSQLSIMDVNGRQLITCQVTEPKTQLDISNLPGGVYFVKLTNDRNVTVGGKFIKQ